MNQFKLHNHPYMERDLQIPKDHVIIDLDVYVELLAESRQKHSDNLVQKRNRIHDASKTIISTEEDHES